ncbi:MAG: DUF861 domain-containing protein [Candidatus Sabulitectum sp.]|nr:DUF861 domain-containing protein [Candidatus Sabulitectum sp.]
MSEFPWEFDMEEACCMLSGKASVTPETGDPVKIGPGYLITFSCTMKFHWRIHLPTRKHYDFR